MQHFIWSLVVGLVVGLIAQVIMGLSGFHPFTLLLGIGGSYVGGMIGLLVSKPGRGAQFHPAGILMSIVGAVIILYIWHHAHLEGSR